MSDKKRYDCTSCPYPRYKDGSVIFCDVCMRRILDEQKAKKKGKERSKRMSEEKRMVGSYEVEQSIFIGEKEVLFGVSQKEEYPFMVCYLSLIHI